MFLVIMRIVKPYKKKGLVLFLQFLLPKFWNYIENIPRTPVTKIGGHGEEVGWIVNILG